ncbi:MAG: leucyl aminopeptidase [Candidatus Sericytochromatia bacterium]|nr:leucyl aminopeptidase [Candidatus Sericytochromatia bacterium]
MQLEFTNASLTEAVVDALVLSFPESEAPPADLPEVLRPWLEAAWADHTFRGAEGACEVLYPIPGVGARRLVLLGLGKDTLTPEAWRKVLAAAVGALHGKARSMAVGLPAQLPPAEAAEATAEAVALAAFETRLYQTAEDKDKKDEQKLATLWLGLAADGPEATAAHRGLDLARVVNRARTLSNMPGNKLTVSDLRDEALAVAQRAGLTARVLEFEDLQREGFGCLVGVGQGSAHRPCFVALEYHGAPVADAAPIVLVGKGITFDTGGICIKPRAGMEEMKTDMHGVATVLGVLEVAAARQLPLNLVGLLPIAENMPSGRALKPGDLLTAYNGLVVEVIDTDAEGRLILSDALAYGAKHYQARYTIDVATLTGSIIMALGYAASGLFSTDDALAEALRQAGEATGERLWRFPIWDAYEFMVKSDIADLANSHPEKGDAIAGAMFLKRFAGAAPWAHLDIAGPSYLSEGKDYRPKGSTGVGIRLLIHWLSQLTTA